jgi:hypothetical protein
MPTRKRNLRFAMPMAVVAKRTAKRRLNGTAQLWVSSEFHSSNDYCTDAVLHI